MSFTAGIVKLFIGKNMMTQGVTARIVENSFPFICILPEFAFPLFIVELSTIKHILGKSKKKAMHSQREEQQAKKVMMTMGVIAIVLVIAMFVAYSYWG